MQVVSRRFFVLMSMILSEYIYARVCDDVMLGHDQDIHDVIFDHFFRYDSEILKYALLIRIVSISNNQINRL